MDEQSRNFDELLVDWHLDRLDDAQHSKVQQLLTQDASLAARSERLGRLLQTLDSWTVSAPPPRLVDQVLTRVAREREQAAPLPAAAGWSGEPRTRVGRAMRARRDLLAAAACILLLLSVVFPGLGALRARAQRMMCANNLASIFRGVSAYQTTFSGSVPYAGSASGAAWLPTGAQDRPYASNSRHAFVLLKGRFGPELKHFSCPSSGSGASVTQLADVGERDDFARASQITYATLNLAGNAPNLTPSLPIAYAGDLNPLFVDARFDPSVDPDHTNSPAHRSRGQTVLTLDGSAHWLTTPMYEPLRDNVWLAGNIRHYIGVEAPVSEDDAQLVPGFPATDPAIARGLRDNTAAH